MLYLGVDLAWGDVNTSGVAALTADGELLDVGLRQGTADVLAWMEDFRTRSDAGLAFLDAPLLVTNPAGHRACDAEIGRRYGRWKVSANPANLTSPYLAGQRLREELQRRGWRYDDGLRGPPTAGWSVSECYPYTTLVGVAELDYPHQRPPYKRRPVSVAAPGWPRRRARELDGIIARLDRLPQTAALPGLPGLPALHLASHPVSRGWLAEPTAPTASAGKKREDMVDAVICAWTAALWHRSRWRRCQVVGAPHGPDAAPGVGVGFPSDVDAGAPLPTIIAPARECQRRHAVRCPACPAGDTCSGGRPAPAPPADPG